MKSTILALTLGLALAAGCGSSGSNGTGTGGSGATGGTTGTGGSGATDGPVMYTLTVNNYLDWCDLTENGTKYPASTPPPMSFPAGTVVDLNAVPNYIFVWGYWTGTDGDTTAAHDTSMSTTVTMTSDKAILACCPDPPPAAPTCP
jgi:hypothetical protein